MPEKNIHVYSLSTCGHCKDTLSYLRRKGVDFSFVDIDLLSREERKQILENVREVNPECSFPTTVVGDRVVVGYNEEKLEEALGD